MKRLTEQQRKILCAIQLNADAPVSEIRKRTKYRDHTIHYYLNRFKDEGIIRRSAFINVYALGYTQYEVYFSLAAKERTVREQLLRFCDESPQIAWYAELGGNFQYAMTICARTGREVTEFLDGLARRFGNVFVKKSLATVVQFNLFRKKYLVPSLKWTDHLSFGETENRSDLDELDQKILNTLFLPGQESVESVARQIRTPRSTVDLRMKKLEERGIIGGYVYLINARKFDMLTYKLLIYVKGIAEGVEKKLFDFSAREPNIVNLLSCIGSWDYELTVEVEDGSQVVRLTQDVYAAFAGIVQEIEILPVFHQAQSKNYMRMPQVSSKAAGSR